MKLIKQLLEALAGDSPTSEELEMAVMAVEKAYQKMCDQHYNDNLAPNSLISPNSSAPFAKVDLDPDSYDPPLWNPVTREFGFQVRDTSRNSMDDGAFMKVNKYGNVKYVERKKIDDHVLTGMHDDPEIQAKLLSKLGKFRPLTDDECGF